MLLKNKKDVLLSQEKLRPVELDKVKTLEVKTQSESLNKPVSLVKKTKPLVKVKPAKEIRITDGQIRKQMIAQSISQYSGSCPCPYFTDRAGRRCGGRSAYSRPGGASPLCYDSDISDATVERVRKSIR